MNEDETQNYNDLKSAVTDLLACYMFIERPRANGGNAVWVKNEKTESFMRAFEHLHELMKGA